MKKKRYAVMLLALLVPLMLLLPAGANAGEPPCFTILVLNPPSDLTVTLTLSDGESQDPLVLERESRVWEAYYRFFYPESFDENSLENAVLTVTQGEGSYTCELPETLASTYNNLFTLDLDTGKLADNQPAWRVPLLVALRVAATLAIEGAVFWLFRYRQRRSWLVFLAVNLVTQTLLNCAITGPGSYTYSYVYWKMTYNVGELVIFLVESGVYAGVLKEHGKGRAVLTALTANAASLLLGGAILTYLPV